MREGAAGSAAPAALVDLRGDCARLAVIADDFFDGEARTHGGRTTLQVVDGRIAAIDPGDHGDALARSGHEVVRVPFLMPALVDAHVHLFLDGAPTDGAARSAHLKQPVDALDEAARRSARQALGCGIVLVRDAGDRHGINNRIRAEARAPGSGLAQVRSGGLGVKRAKRYGAFMARDVDGDDSIRESVQALARDNDEIKLILTGIIDFDAGAVTDAPQFDEAETRLVVETAHRAGRKVFAHCSGTRGLRIAAAAGVDSIEHGFFIDDEVLARMRDAQLAWTPTFCPVHFQWAHPEAVGWSPATVDNLRRILDDHATHLQRAHALGVPLLVGTDAGSMGVEHGFALFDEVDRFLEAGLPLEAVLAAATSAPRRHFGLPPTLGIGAPFDALSLVASPFDAPLHEARSTLRAPHSVWIGSGGAVR